MQRNENVALNKLDKNTFRSEGHLKDKNLLTENANAERNQINFRQFKKLNIKGIFKVGLIVRPTENEMLSHLTEIGAELLKLPDEYHDKGLTLDFSNHDMKDITHDEMVEFTEAWKNNNFPRHMNIDFQKTKLSDDQFSVMGNALMSGECQKDMTLNLSRTTQNNIDKAAQTNSVSSLVDVMKLVLASGKCPKRLTLDLSYNNISEQKDIDELFLSMFSSNTKDLSIRLQGNHIENINVDDIFKRLENSQKNMINQDDKLRMHVDLSHNKLGKGITKSLYNMVKVNPYFTGLDVNLEDNHIKSDVLAEHRQDLIELRHKNIITKTKVPVSPSLNNRFATFHKETTIVNPRDPKPGVNWEERDKIKEKEHERRHCKLAKCTIL